MNAATKAEADLRLIPNECRARILQYIKDPTPDGWDDIKNLLIGRNVTIWQAIIENDPTFQRVAPSGSPGKIRAWKRIPSAEEVLLVSGAVKAIGGLFPLPAPDSRVFSGRMVRLVVHPSKHQLPPYGTLVFAHIKRFGGWHILSLSAPDGSMPSYWCNRDGGAVAKLLDEDLEYSVDEWMFPPPNPSTKEGQ